MSETVDANADVHNGTDTGPKIDTGTNEGADTVTRTDTDITAGTGTDFNVSAKTTKHSSNVVNKDNPQTPSLLTVFWRSACYEGKFLQHHSWDYVMLLWLPLLTMLSIWWIFSQPYIVDLPIGVIDNSKSSYSRTVTRYLEASPDLTVARQYQDVIQANEAILDQQIYGVVIIPSDFATAINKAAPSPIILKINAQYGTHSGIIQRGVQSVIGTLSAGVEMQRSIKQGQSAEQVKTTYSPIGIERISLFNLGANYQQFLASTVIPALLHILIMIVGATTIGREIRDKTFAIWYHNITSPQMPYPDFKSLKHLPPDEKLAFIHSQIGDSWQSPIDYRALASATYSYPAHPATTGNLLAPTHQRSLNASISHKPPHKPLMPANISMLALIVGLNGKLLWALLFYMLWGGMMIALAVSVHPTSITAMLVVFVAFVALTMISLWLGVIFSLLSYSLRMGLSLTGFVSAPSFAFAGVTFPLLAMSDGAQRWANILPLTHYLKVHLSQLQMMAPPYLVMSTVYGLIAMVFVTLIIAALMSLRAFKHPERWGAR